MDNECPECGWNRDGTCFRCKELGGEVERVKKDNIALREELKQKWNEKAEITKQLKLERICLDGLVDSLASYTHRDKHLHENLKLCIAHQKSRRDL